MSDNEIEEQLTGMVEDIVSRLTAICRGELMVCPEHGETVADDCTTCPQCGADLEYIDLMDELGDNLGVDVIADLDGTFRHCRVMVAWGGPNIWVDCDKGVVEGHWGSTVVERRLGNTVCDCIDDLFESLWRCH